MYRLISAGRQRSGASVGANPAYFFWPSCTPRLWLCPLLLHFGSWNPFVSHPLSNLGGSASRSHVRFWPIPGSRALWIFFAGDFQWGSARTRTDSDCPKRVLDDPQRRHGHPMGQKKITQRGTIWQWARCVCTDTPNRCPRTHSRLPRWELGI
jgi:hypothetical protein